MALEPSDGWLWVSLAILGYFGSLTVHGQLLAIRQASEVTRHGKRPNISQHTEDALKLKALGELIQSPDQDIRAASVKVITDRVIRDGPAWDMITGDIAGTDIERRDKALACLRFLCTSYPHGELVDIVVDCSHSTYKAVVDCLCNLLPEAQRAEKRSAFRTQSERNALYVLHHILDFDVPKAVEVGVISRWLVQYPFGGMGASNYKKKKNVLEILENGSYYEDSDFGGTMRAMLLYMSRTSLLRKEMLEHGLLDFPKGNNIPVGLDFPRREQWLWTDDIKDDREMPENTPSTDSYRARMRRGAVAEGASIRPMEESFEEQALRRRRREAMVLGEAGRPIERADIIEREPLLGEFRVQGMASPDDEQEGESVVAVADGDLGEELELLVEEGIIEAESIGNGGWWGWLKRLRPDGLAPEPA